MHNRFGQILKLWRQRLGFSQMELSLLAGLSSKHISFLETGKSQPTRETIYRIADAMALSAEDTQLLVKYAGLQIQAGMLQRSATTETALQMMLEKQEPYPAIISDYTLTPLFFNKAATRMLEWLGMAGKPFNTIMDMLYSSEGLKPYVTNWDEMSTRSIRLIRMKARDMQGHPQFEANLASLFENTHVLEVWEREQAFIGNTEPVVPIELDINGKLLSWHVILSTYGTPRNVSLDEYQLEFFYPGNPETRAFAESHLA